MATRIDKRDLPWVALIVVSFIFGLAVSWERWGNPLVDCGREMNQPLRLMHGEMLYSSVRHIYGPLSPYLNALLYRIFAPSLWVLFADGIVSALFILAVVYWLSRQMMGRAAASAATLGVMWLCAFKQAGNYLLPYSYSALHGCAFGLACLAMLVRFAQESAGDKPEKSTDKPLMMAGAFCGLAILAKTEMGLASVSAGLISVALVGYPSSRRTLRHAATFVLPLVLLVGGCYGYIATRVGWHTLADDSLLFFRHLPPELVYFNKRMSGFDQPLQSLMQMIGAAARLASLAAIIATISLLATRAKQESAPARIPLDLSVSDAGKASYLQIWSLLAASLLVFVLIPFAGTLNWEQGPYLAMPILLLGLLLLEFNRYRKQAAMGVKESKSIIVLIIAVFALASLARVVLRVRSGGAYSSYLLPSSIVVFTYAWTHSFAGSFREVRTRTLARNIVVALLLADAALTAGLLSYRYRDKNTYPLKTDRGTMLAVPDLGESMDQAISYIKRETIAGEPVAVMPEGTSLNFFTDRPNPLREEILTPGYLDSAGEERAIEHLKNSNTRLVLVTNRPTPEFGPQVFGRDYCQVLMQWIQNNFEECAIFGPDHDPNQQVGDKTFFIRAYRKRESYNRES